MNISSISIAKLINTTCVLQRGVYFGLIKDVVIDPVTNDIYFLIDRRTSSKEEELIGFDPFAISLDDLFSDSEEFEFEITLCSQKHLNPEFKSEVS